MVATKQVVIAAGGTGGHIFPGLALAHELQSRGYQVSWLGTRRGLESQLIPAANIPLHFIDIEGIRGKGLIALLKAPFLIFKAIMQARKILKRLAPGVVVGMGGFVAGPGGVAARLTGIPLVIHEQNAIAGTTNKLLAKFATEVLVAFPGAIAKAHAIGNPVRADIINIPDPQIRYANTGNGLNILVVGGSRGARAINRLLPDMLKVISEREGAAVFSSLRICHQAGQALFAETCQAYEQAGIKTATNSDEGHAFTLLPFVDDMADKLGWAHLVICRSGALTVSEIAAAGVAAIFIPFPYAIDDHQTANGEYLEASGAALLWQQKSLTANILADQIVAFVKSPEKLIAMAKKARSLARPKATADFADCCEKYLNGVARAAEAKG